MPTTVIVCGYDLDTDLYAYSASAIHAIGDDGFDALVLSGGRTSPRSVESEALVMSRAFAELLPHRKPILDEEAMSSLENLLHGRRLAPAERYLVICDHAHRRKVSVLARLTLGRGAAVRSVARPTSWITHALEPFSLVLESIAALVPATRRGLRSGARLLKSMRYRAFFTSVSQ